MSAALRDMVGKPTSEVKVGFVPTAANVEDSNKDWVIGQLLSLWRNGFAQIDIVDFSAAGVDWRSRLDAVDMLWLSGGNTFHLLDQARKTGFDKWLKEALKTKVYVGGSASSILMTPSIAVSALEPGDENLPGITDLTGIGVVPFEIEPHCDAARIEWMKEYADKSPNPVYAIDDATAIQVINGEVTVISTGSWRLYDK